MRSYDPWDAGPGGTSSGGRLRSWRDRWARGICLPVQLSPRTWRGQGAGKSAQASWLLSCRGPKGGERKGGTRDRERLSGAVCVSIRVCVSVRESVCVCECPAQGGGWRPRQRRLVLRPVQACFLPKLLMSLQLQKPGDL